MKHSAGQIANRDKQFARIHDNRRREFIGSHKKCSACREWKTLDKFYPIKMGLGGVRAKCKECYLEERRKYKYALPAERYDGYVKSSTKATCIKRRKAMDERYKDCIFIIKELLKDMGSIRAVSRASGVDRDALSAILRKKSLYVHKETYRKLKDLYVDHMEMRLQFDL